MSKYIIDLRPDCKVVQQICVSDDNVGVGARSVELFDALTDDYVKENFKHLLDAEHEQGLNESWECARKIVCDDSCGGMSMKELLEIFKRGSDAYILRDFTAQQAIEMLKAYEKKQRADDKIKVRDEVVWTEDENVVIVVTSVHTADDMEWCDGVCKDGKVYSILMKNARKTGRRFDIQKILEEMRND